MGEITVPTVTSNHLQRWLMSHDSGWVQLDYLPWSLEDMKYSEAPQIRTRKSEIPENPNKFIRNLLV